MNKNTIPKSNPINTANTADAYFDIIRTRMGWDTATINKISKPHPDTFHLDGVDIAATRINKAIEHGEQITVITDYDMDGIAAGVMAYAGLSELGANVNLVLPDYTAPREVTPKRIDAAVALYPETKVIITCDSGINSYNGINHAQNDLGIDVIVTDHHEEEHTPQNNTAQNSAAQNNTCPAFAVLNPNKIDSSYPIEGICGAQVLYILLLEYTRIFRKDKLSAMSYLAVFAGIGASADVMPITYWTRGILRTTIAQLRLAIPQIGLNLWGNYDLRSAKDMANLPYQSTLMHLILSDGDNHHPHYIRAFYGLSAYMLGLIQKEKIKKPDYIEASFIGYTLAPMFNTVRRIEADMRHVFNVFTPEVVKRHSPDFAVDDIQTSVYTLIDNNEHRKEITKQAIDRINNSEQPYAPFVYFADVAPGLLGLIANNLSRKNNVPVIVLNPHTLSGSARSPQWAPLISLGQELNRNGVKFQGHEYACGASFNTKIDILAFVDHLTQFIKQLPQETTNTTKPTLHLSDNASNNLKNLLKRIQLEPDGVVEDPEQIIKLVEKLDGLKPFGHGFTYPSIAITCDVKYLHITAMGKQLQHLKISTPSGISIIGWNKADLIDEIKNSIAITAYVELTVNEFNEMLTPQAIIDTIDIHSQQDLDRIQGLDQVQDLDQVSVIND